MASPGERFEAWIDSLGTKFSARVGAWLGAALSAGIDTFMKLLGKSFAPKLKPLIDSIEATGAVPPELKPILDELKVPTGEVAGAIFTSLGGKVANSAVGDFLNAYLAPIGYAALRQTRNTRLGVDVILGLGLRGIYAPEVTKYNLSLYGFSDAQITNLQDLLQVILPSEIVLPAWLRDKAKYQKFVDDLPKLGLSPEAIELLKELAYKYPTAEQAITWMAHEVFEDDMAAKYGLDDESDKLNWDFLEKIGINRDIGGKHWRSHWQHASWTQIVEMLHRGLVNEEDVWDWFRLVEIPPFWRQNLTKTMYNLPGRIEIRMMALYGLVDKAKVKELLKADGLAEEYLDLVADMNIVRGVRTDIQTRYIKGWLDSEGVKAEIDKLGLTPPMPDRLYQWIVKNTKSERTLKEKDLTKAEIVKAVKVGEIAWADGVELIEKMGYDEDEAGLILAIGIPVAAEELTDIQKIQIDTIRRQRRKQLISHDDEIRALLAIGISAELATAYADNDEVRLGKITGEEAP